MRRGKTRITKSAIEDYIHCKRKGILRLQGEVPTKDPHLQLLDELASAYSLKAKDRLARLVRDPADVASPATDEILGLGKKILFDASVTSSDYTTLIDALQLVKIDSRLGAFSYAPIRFARTGPVTSIDKILLAFDGVVLGQIQGVRPKHGTVVHGPTYRNTRVDLEPYYDEVKSLCSEVSAVAASDYSEDPPILIAHCQLCQFRERCRKEARDVDHLSLLSGISETQIRRHNSKGIFTVNQLSYTYRERRPKKRAKRTSNAHNFALQALALRRQQVFVRGDPTLQAAKTCVFVDVEGIPNPNTAYLLGAVLENAGSDEYVSFWADNPRDESHLLRSFIDWLPDNEDTLLFHYGSYDSKAFKRMARQLPESYARRMTDIETRMVNILSIVHQHIYFHLFEQPQGNCQVPWLPMVRPQRRQQVEHRMATLLGTIEPRRAQTAPD